MLRSRFRPGQLKKIAEVGVIAIRCECLAVTLKTRRRFLIENFHRDVGKNFWGWVPQIPGHSNAVRYTWLFAGLSGIRLRRPLRADSFVVLPARRGTRRFQSGLPLIVSGNRIRLNWGDSIYLSWNLRIWRRVGSLRSPDIGFDIGLIVVSRIRVRGRPFRDWWLDRILIGHSGIPIGRLCFTRRGYQIVDLLESRPDPLGAC